MKPSRLPTRRIKHQPFTRLIPNILTLLSMCAGATALRFAFNDRFEAAAAAILLAAILDLLDGGMARLLRASSRFGAELDSLADLVSFGIAPGVIVYFWATHDAGSAGWAPTLLFCVCAALRLARFNVEQETEETPRGRTRYFTGLPTPAAAGIVLLPMLLGFQFPDGPFDHVLLNGTVLVLAALLMVSRVPTFSLKGGLVPNKFVIPVLLVICLLAGFAVDAPWTALTIVLSLYILSIPLSLLTHTRMQRKAKEETPPA